MRPPAASVRHRHAVLDLSTPWAGRVATARGSAGGRRSKTRPVRSRAAARWLLCGAPPVKVTRASATPSLRLVTSGFDAEIEGKGARVKCCRPTIDRQNRAVDERGGW